VTSGGAYLEVVPLNGRGQPRSRWLILCLAWAVVAWLGTLDALAMRDYVAMLDDSGTLPVDSLL